MPLVSPLISCLQIDGGHQVTIPRLTYDQLPSGILSLARRDLHGFRTWAGGRSRTAANITEVQDARRPVAPDLSALADQLVGATRTQDIEPTDPSGLLTGLTTRSCRPRWTWS